MANGSDKKAKSPPEFKPKVRRRSLAGRQKLCPQCQSELKIGSPLSGWLVPNFYICEKCGYSGYVALEEAPKEDD